MTDVFLGGSCDPTTWRADIARPAFDAKGITYFDPQVKPVENWGDRATIETTAKATAHIILIVIDRQTSAITSMMESIELIALGRDVVLVVQHIPQGTLIGGETISERQRRDLNRPRAYLRDDFAPRHGVAVYETVNQAVAEICQRLTREEAKCSAH
jgi:raw